MYYRKLTEKQQRYTNMLDDFRRTETITDFQEENKNDRSGICG